MVDLRSVGDPVDAAERWRPEQPRTALILPFLFGVDIEGATPNGLIIGGTAAGIHGGPHQDLPKIFGLVLKAHPLCREARANDLFLMRKHAFEDGDDTHQAKLYVLHEDNILARLIFGDGTMRLNPCGERVVILAAKAREYSETGKIVMPETAIDTRPQEGVVIRVGAEVPPKRFKGGEKVVFSRHAGTEIMIEGKANIVLSYKDILATMEDDE